MAWRFTAADRVHASPTVGKDGAILFGSQDDHVYALEPDGRLRWFLTFDADIDSAPLITPAGLLVVGGDDKAVRAFR